MQIAGILCVLMLETLFFVFNISEAHFNLYGYWLLFNGNWP